MNQEDKQLLLKALCALLPYNTIVSVAEGESGFTEHKIKWHNVILTSYLLHQIEEEVAWKFIKPYLRPMSSMTEEEELTLDETRCYTQLTLESYDWLNAHHFDYRGLIEKGLAIDCTGLHIYDY